MRLVNFITQLVGELVVAFLAGGWMRVAFVLLVIFFFPLAFTQRVEDIRVLSLERNGYTQTAEPCYDIAISLASDEIIRDHRCAPADPWIEHVRPGQAYPASVAWVPIFGTQLNWISVATPASYNPPPADPPSQTIDCTSFLFWTSCELSQ